MNREALTEKDCTHLKTAVDQALKGRGAVEPNPMVGAVCVKNGHVVAKGYHARYGAGHAEIGVLKKAGPQTRGSTLYITLEPCSSHGKTPPCTEAIVAAGVETVVVGAIDPDGRHGGRGLALLEEAGIRIRYSPDESCDSLLQGFRYSLRLGRPHVILKWAATLDGRIAAADRSSQWISCEKSRDFVHRLRGHVDGIMVGAGTALADDPRLNCRKSGVPLVPKRIVVDPRLQLPPKAALLRNAGGGKDDEGFEAGPVWILARGDVEEKRVADLKEAGAEVVQFDSPSGQGDRFLEDALAYLEDEGIHRLLVEGGSFLFTRLIEAGLADQVMAFIAPKIVGGKEALGPVEGRGRVPMSEALSLERISTRASGEDILFQGFFPWYGS